MENRYECSGEDGMEAAIQLLLQAGLLGDPDHDIFVNI